eukprot:m.33385 g.33385  ORF g.33385 m.33385 type:complete len:408 (+) comp15220_c0_seq1:76-1299(+)
MPHKIPFLILPLLLATCTFLPTIFGADTSTALPSSTSTSSFEHDERTDSPTTLARKPELVKPRRVPSAAENGVTLPRGLLSHKFCFVIGTHHSGTSLFNLLLQEHPDVSGLQGTHKPENEGQHVQNIYDTAVKLGGMLKYAFNPDSAMTEKHPLATPENRVRLYKSWKPYWNVSKPVLVEKSPRHTVMTRFLQYMFSPSRSHFIILMRHPLGSSHFRWGKVRRVPMYDCGRSLIDHWLTIHDLIRKDIRHLENKLVFQMEEFLGNNPQAETDRLFEFLGLEPMVELTVESGPFPTKRKKKRCPVCPCLERQRRRRSEALGDGDEGRSGVGRKLLNFHGKRRQLAVRVGTEMSWAKEWSYRVDVESEVCKTVVKDFEARLNEYGYSLIDLSRVSKPTAFGDAVVRSAP